MLKENDFIELSYTGKLKENGFVFDTTDKALAEQHGIHNPQAQYDPVIVCLGNGHLLQGLDKALIGKTLGKYTFEFSPEQGFGKKNASLIQLIATGKFKKDGIVPYPGLQINVDGAMGVIKTVTGGRTLVDFNHPLAGKELTYDVHVKRVVTDIQEQASAFIKLALGMSDAQVDVVDGKAHVKTTIEIPKEVHDQLFEGVRKVVPTLKGIEYETVKEKKAVKRVEQKEHVHDEHCEH